MATVLPFPRKSPSKLSPHLIQSSPSTQDKLSTSPQLVERSPCAEDRSLSAQDRRPPVQASPQDRIAASLALTSQIALAVSHMDEEIARLAARTNIHRLPA
jgi:hypothetical protein